MLNIKRTFFLSKQECEQLHPEDGYITFVLPHYELEDGRIFYGHMGAGPHGALTYYSEKGTTWKDLFPPADPQMLIQAAPKNTKKKGRDS